MRHVLVYDRRTVHVGVTSTNFPDLHIALLLQRSLTSNNGKTPSQVPGTSTMDQLRLQLLLHSAQNCDRRSKVRRSERKIK